MTLQEKYRLSLLQLQEYSGNETILIEGESLTIQNELDWLQQTPQPTDIQAQRITENIFEVLGNTNWANVAVIALKDRFKDNNVVLDKTNGIITVQDSEGETDLYTIKISKV